MERNGWIGLMRNGDHDDTRFGATDSSVAGSNNDSGTGTDMGGIASAPGSDNNDSGSSSDFGRPASTVPGGSGARTPAAAGTITGPPDNMLGVPDAAPTLGVKEATGGHPGQQARGV